MQILKIAPIITYYRSYLNNAACYHQTKRMWNFNNEEIVIKHMHTSTTTQTKSTENTPTEASTNPKNFDLSKNFNMNLIWIETRNLKLETETWNR